MKFKIDLHVHSKFSGDNESEPEEAVIHAIASGLQGIAFTEHYSYAAAGYVDELRGKYKGRILIFRGVEFSSAEGHCLVFGVNTDMLHLKNAPMEEVVNAVNKEGGVTIPSHPFRGSNSIGNTVRDLGGIIAIEGHNGYSHYSQNLRAVKTAGELGLPYTGGSDAHAAKEVGACYTEFSCEVSYDNFIGQLRGGNYRGVDTRKVSRIWP